MVTEYGPGVDPGCSFLTSRNVSTSHRNMVWCIINIISVKCMKRPFIAGSSLWNLNDFYSESRVDAVPHVNNKGVVGLDREKKRCLLVL